jgi:dGTP triphosphohydrolase
MRSVYVDGVIQSLDIQTNRMVGEIMNLIEASLPDSLPTTALKKSIKQAMWRTNRTIQDDVNGMSFTNEDKI